MAEDILQRIESAGTSGIKKTDLKKRYGKDCDDILEKLKEAEQIFIEKKGMVYFIWTKENYIRHLTQNDPKFKVLLDMVLGVSQSVATLRERTQNLREEMESISSQDSALTNNRDFENIFNKCLHKEAKSAIRECIKELNEKVRGREAATGDFRVITVIQDVGSGKTHLALHIKNLKGRHNTECSFVDLSTISPKTISSIYNAILKGFENEFFVQLRTKFLGYLRERAEKGDNFAKKAIEYSFVNKLSGLTIREKVENILREKQSVSVENLNKFLIQRFNHFESTFIKSVITNSFASIGNLE